MSTRLKTPINQSINKSFARGACTPLDEALVTKKLIQLSIIPSCPTEYSLTTITSKIKLVPGDLIGTFQ